MSDDQSVRAWLDEQLTPLIEPVWRIIPNQRMPETLDRVTVVIKHTEIKRLPEAPQSSYANEVIITVVDPHQDQDRAEDALDDEVLALVHALDQIEGIAWAEAKKVLVQEPYLGWDITCSIISKKKEPPIG